MEVGRVGFLRHLGGQLEGAPRWLWSVGEGEALMKTLCQLTPLSKQYLGCLLSRHEKSRRTPGKKRSFIVKTYRV